MNFSNITLRQARRIVAAVIGATLLIIGGILLLIPGPGIPVVLGGLVILSSEFLWARKLLHRVRERIGLKPADPPPVAAPEAERVEP